MVVVRVPLNGLFDLKVSRNEESGTRLFLLKFFSLNPLVLSLCFGDSTLFILRILSSFSYRRRVGGLLDWEETAVDAFKEQLS